MLIYYQEKHISVLNEHKQLKILNFKCSFKHICIFFLTKNNENIYLSCELPRRRTTDVIFSVDSLICTIK